MSYFNRLVACAKLTFLDGSWTENRPADGRTWFVRDVVTAVVTLRDFTLWSLSMSHGRDGDLYRQIWKVRFATDGREHYLYGDPLSAVESAYRDHIRPALLAEASRVEPPNHLLDRPVICEAELGPGQQVFPESTYDLMIEYYTEYAARAHKNSWAQ